MRKNIFAFTETAAPSYPGYISVNKEADGRHTVAVRTRGHGGAQQAFIEMPPHELEAMGRAIFAHLEINLVPISDTKSAKRPNPADGAERPAGHNPVA